MSGTDNDSVITGSSGSRYARPSARRRHTGADSVSSVSDTISTRSVPRRYSREDAEISDSMFSHITDDTLEEMNRSDVSGAPRWLQLDFLCVRHTLNAVKYIVLYVRVDKWRHKR